MCTACLFDDASKHFRPSEITSLPATRRCPAQLTILRFAQAPDHAQLDALPTTEPVSHRAWASPASVCASSAGLRCRKCPVVDAAALPRCLSWSASAEKSPETRLSVAICWIQRWCRLWSMSGYDTDDTDVVCGCWRDCFCRGHNWDRWSHPASAEWTGLWSTCLRRHSVLGRHWGWDFPGTRQELVSWHVFVFYQLLTLVLLYHWTRL